MSLPSHDVTTTSTCYNLTTSYNFIAVSSASHHHDTIISPSFTIISLSHDLLTSLSPSCYHLTVNAPLCHDDDVTPSSEHLRVSARKKFQGQDESGFFLPHEGRVSRKKITILLTLQHPSTNLPWHHRVTTISQCYYHISLLESHHI